MLIHKAAHQRMLAQHVDDTGDAARIAVDQVDRFRLENHFAIGTGDLQPLIDIGASLVQHEWMRFGAQRNPLPQLPQLRLPQFGLELGLSHENDLQ